MFHEGFILPLDERRAWWCGSCGEESRDAPASAGDRVIHRKKKYGRTPAWRRGR